MIKTLVRFRAEIKQEKENFRIPHSVQCRTLSPSGVSGRTASSRRAMPTVVPTVSRISTMPSPVKQTKRRCCWVIRNCSMCWIRVQVQRITINNRRVDRRQFEQELLIRPQADKLNGYRQEYNDMLCSHAASSNNVVQERYLTISAHKRSVDEARAYFQRMGARSQHASGSCPRRPRNWMPLPGCRSCAIFSRQASPLLCHSIWSREQSAVMISRTGSAPTAWSFTPTFSSRTSDGAGCCIYRITQASSRMILSWSCAGWTAA